MMLSVRKIGVLGAGQMGSGIAQVAAQSGFEVLLSDKQSDLSVQAKKKIANQLRKRIEKGTLNPSEEKEILDRIHAVSSLSDLAPCQMIIEAVSENVELKFQIFKQLAEMCSPETLLTSNTSSISITTIAAQTRYPEKVAGIHFMNPVPIMKLVEGIRGLQTSDETFSIVRQVAEKMGKTFIEAKDQPGFAINRILMPMINEAITTLYEGIASKEDIDTGMKLGTNHPMGPLTLADFIGLDTCLAIMELLHKGFGDSKYRPSPLLKQYVAAGWLGKKTGRGFYRYDT